MSFRSHVFLGTTQSLCPECLTLVPAKIIERGGRVYFRKRCPTHGVREDFVCSDVDQYDRMEFSVAGKTPAKFGAEAEKGCPFDCGLCDEHEQHTCIGIVEVTSSCNLQCPTCYATSGPSGRHLSFDECKRAIDRLVEVEGRPEILQLSGGEPTIHPELPRILDYALAQPIDYVMINTNGIRIANDADFVRSIARPRVEVYLQFDGFRSETYRKLRGEDLAAIKLRAIDALGKASLNTILVATLEAGVNDDEIGAIVRFGLERPWITGVSFQPVSYSGRFVAPQTLEGRITFPDVIRAVAAQTNGMFRERDFLPLACAHPNCHQLTYAYRAGGKAIPLTRYIDAKKNLDLLANGITFTRPRVRSLIERFLGRLGACGPGCGCNETPAEIGSPLLPLATGESYPPEIVEFFGRALGEQLAPADVFRITITSFLDPYTFDVRRLMKCCVHHILPSGHVIPFCAYNTLYRNGHVALPPLVDAVPLPAGPLVELRY